MFTSLRTWIAILLMACLFEAAARPCQAQESGKLPDVKRIVFLGDSITHGGGYIVTLEAAARVQYPDRKIEFLNVGLPSETVSGLSEPGHAGGQFPRPDVHERLARVLDATRPELVVACYGMNCGMYYPLSDDRFAKFKSGIERLHQAVVDRGAKIIHLTPAFFDSLPNEAKLLPAGLAEYTKPYVGYDEVLQSYAEWLMSKRSDGWEVYDVHAAMKSAVMEHRKTEPQFTFAKDGVHPNQAGQVVIARVLASAWGLKLDDQGLPQTTRAAELVKLVADKQQTLKLSWLTKTKHVRPGIAAGLPLEEAEAKAAEIDRKISLLVK